MAVHPLH